jgi:hypothetical protein
MKIEVRRHLGVFNEHEWEVILLQSVSQALAEMLVVEVDPGTEKEWLTCLSSAFR